MIDLVSLFHCKLNMYNVCKRRIYFARDTVKKNLVELVCHSPSKRLKNKKKIDK